MGFTGSTCSALPVPSAEVWTNITGLSPRCVNATHATRFDRPGAPPSLGADARLLFGSTLQTLFGIHCYNVTEWRHRQSGSD